MPRASINNSNSAYHQYYRNESNPYSYSDSSTPSKSSYELSRRVCGIRSRVTQPLHQRTWKAVLPRTQDTHNKINTLQNDNPTIFNPLSTFENLVANNWVMNYNKDNCNEKLQNQSILALAAQQMLLQPQNLQSSFSTNYNSLLSQNMVQLTDESLLKQNCLYSYSPTTTSAQLQMAFIESYNLYKNNKAIDDDQPKYKFRFDHYSSKIMKSNLQPKKWSQSYEQRRQQQLSLIQQIGFYSQQNLNTISGDSEQSQIFSDSQESSDLISNNLQKPQISNQEQQHNYQFTPDTNNVKENKHEQQDSKQQQGFVALNNTSHAFKSPEGKFKLVEGQIWKNYKDTLPTTFKQNMTAQTISETPDNQAQQRNLWDSSNSKLIGNLNQKYLCSQLKQFKNTDTQDKSANISRDIYQEQKNMSSMCFEDTNDQVNHYCHKCEEKTKSCSKNQEQTNNFSSNINDDAQCMDGKNQSSDQHDLEQLLNNSIQNIQINKILSKQNITIEDLDQ
eukprot:403332588